MRRKLEIPFELTGMCIEGEALKSERSSTGLKAVIEIEGQIASFR
jgi:hypothetical protein